MLQRRSELAFSTAILAFAAFWVWEARELQPNTRLFPWIIGFPVVVLALLQCVSAIRGLLKPTAEAREPVARMSAESLAGAGSRLDLSSAAAAAATASVELAEAEAEVPPDVARARSIAAFLWILGFFFALILLGFRVGAPLMTFLFLRIGSRETMKLSLVFAVTTYLFLLFADLSHSITLSTGMIAQSLGLESFDAYLVNPIIRLIRGG